MRVTASTGRCIEQSEQNRTGDSGMARRDTTGVGAAFEILLEEIERVIKKVNESCSRALSEGRYEDAEQMINRAKDLGGFRSKIISLHQDWKELYDAYDKEARTYASRRKPGRLKRGAATKKEFYCIPILQVLCEMGGVGLVGEVLDRVYDIVKDSLKPADKERLPSGIDLRWRNAAQWARWRMVKEGLLKEDSPYGVWEISEAGREWLERHKNVNEI